MYVNNYSTSFSLVFCQVYALGVQSLLANRPLEKKLFFVDFEKCAEKPTTFTKKNPARAGGTHAFLFL
jgi:hypothetical protein